MARHCRRFAIHPAAGQKSVVDTAHCGRVTPIRDEGGSLRRSFRAMLLGHRPRRVAVATGATHFLQWG